MREKERLERLLPHVKEKNRISSIKYRKKHEKELKEYRQNNKQKLCEISERYRNKHPHIVAWRGILHSTLKRMGTKKEGHTIDVLGYSATDLKHHIEKQFTTGMNWENHGQFGWHIDHKIPLNSAKTEDEIYKLCHYTNLQPLWWRDNISKGDKLPETKNPIGD